MRIWLCLFPFFCFLTILVEGQNTYPPNKQYTLRDGLSQMQVISLFQDSRGYIWAGTKEGLNCFNGDKIIRFAEKDGLPNAYIQRITEDFEGNIWVSTRKGFSRFDGKTWKSYYTENFYLGYVAPTPDGKVWYIAADQKLKPIFGYLENDEFHDQKELLPELDHADATEIAYSKSSQVLIFHDQHNLFELKNGVVKKILQAKENLFMELRDSVILVMESNQKEFINLFEYNKGQLKELANIRNGRIIGESRSTRKYTFFPRSGDNPLYIIYPDTLVVKAFPEMHKSCCLTDKDGQLWIGTEEGLYQIQSGGFETYKREDLPAIWAILEDGDQNIWFVSYNYGLKKFNGKSLTTFQPKDLMKYEQKEENKNYNLNFHFHPSVDKRGTVYFPNNIGILAYDGHFFKISNRLGCLTSFYDRERDLLWGGYHLLAEIYDRNHKLVRSIRQADGMEINGYVATISKDREGFYWLGGFTGLCRYNWDTEKSVNYNRANGRLPADGVMSTFNTPDGRTWFGSTHGLLFYDNRIDSIRKIDFEEISGTVSFVTAIDSTWLVFSQSTGVYLMDLKKFNHSGEVELHLFNEQNGFMGIDPGQDGAMVDSKGNIWMTSSTEVVKLDPKKLVFEKYMANMRISVFNGQKVSYSQEEVSLPRNDRSAIVQFDAICFNRPNEVEYSWKVEGSGNDWSAWQKEDYAVLTNLSDGQTHFQVRMKVPGLPRSEASASIYLLVNLALWKQEWFFPTIIGIVSLSVILALLLLFQARAKMVQVGKHAKMFQLQAILSQMNPHFIFNVMASLQSMILTTKIEKANEYLVKMSNLIRGFLEASVSTGISNSKDFKQGELSLQNALEVVTNFIQFQQLIYPDKFDYELYIDSEIDPVQQTLPPMLIQPFVENAIRHGLLQKAEKGLLKISIIKTAKGELNIDIEDDGIGIQKASEMIRRSSLLYTSRGKELTLMRIKLLNELGYNIRFNTLSSEKGTRITLTIGYAI